MEGEHTIDRCYDVTVDTLRRVFAAMAHQRVITEQLVLKTSMVISAKKCPVQASVETVAAMTVRCLLNAVPASVPGIVFLSGGQSPQLATEHLNAMHVGGQKYPWPLSFSYGRALQEPALKTWKGNAANVDAAQKALHHREKMNSLACLGKYTTELEKAA